MLELTNAKIDGLAALPMDRRDFLKGAASAAGTVAAASVSETAQATPVSKPGVPWDPNSRMGIGINLEYVRHADKSLAYGIRRAGQIGYKWVEPCFLDGRCLLSNAGYCHVTSMDTDPKIIKDLCAEAGVKISGLSWHSHLLNPEAGVLYARRGIRYAPALGVNVV
ncbi:MAG: twin-arginine translocation signal domain-containing protein, partial [Planctomycetota bacterium]